MKINEILSNAEKAKTMSKFTGLLKKLCADNR